MSSVQSNAVHILLIPECNTILVNRSVTGLWQNKEINMENFFNFEIKLISWKLRKQTGFDRNNRIH